LKRRLKKSACWKSSLKVVPYAGWLKLIFYEGQKSSYEKDFAKKLIKV
jgi:hypothetical protein